jgi:hypothetical protein
MLRSIRSLEGLNLLAKDGEIGEVKAVSRQMEQQYFGYYRWPYYWTGAGIWGSGAFRLIPPGVPPAELHLRSTKEVTGYKVEATDAAFGHVEDLIIEDDSWKIRYLVTDTKSFWPSKSVLLPSDWVDSVSWNDRKFRINLSEKVIKQAPEFDLTQPIDRDFEKRLFGYYGRPGYWESREPIFQKRSVG